jgi:hypothetical protein
VAFSIDGVGLGAEDTESPYTASFSGTSYTSGPHTLAAVARDAAGNTATSSITIHIYASKPSITAAALPSTTLVAGEQVIAKIVVSEVAAAWRKLVIRATRPGSVTLSNIQVYDQSTAYDFSGFWVPGAQPVPGVTVSVSDQSIVLESSIDQPISGTVVYIVRATVGEGLQPGDTLATSVQPSGLSIVAPTALASVPTSATFVWSDLSGSPHSDASSDWNTDAILALPTTERVMTY